MNYYSRHLGDYARDTGHLSILEHGAYTLLLDRYYVSEAGIPADQAHRLARARTREEKQAVDMVLEEFFTLEEGIWINKRCEEEIAKAQTQIKANQENGRKGGRPRKKAPGSENETQEKPNGFSMGSENETEVKGHQTPITNSQLIKESTSYFQSESADSAGAEPAPENLENPPPDTGGRRPAGSLPDCPHGQILALYARHLPHLTQHRSWEGARREKLRCRWQQAAKPSAYSPEGYASEAAGLQWWDSFLQYIATETRLPAGFERDDGGVWRPDLDWICTAGNFQKIIDGKYDK